MSIFGRILSVCAALILVGCLDLNGKTIKEGDTEIDVVDPAKIVCNPFDDYTPTFLERGLVGKLYYSMSAENPYRNVDEFIENAESYDLDLYFNRLFVPTRAWDRGFYTMDGQLVTNPNGEPLYENFAVDMETVLKLSPGEAPGYYQMAILADDGALLRIHEESGDRILINNDDLHPTKMGCAEEPIYLDENTRIPVQIRYMQGPRYHIALTVMWRPYPADPHDVRDPLCTRSGNSYFWDSTTQPSTPKPNFYALLEGGWKVLEGTNFQLPTTVENPCVLQEVPLEITNLVVSNVTRTSVTVSWVTNIPATSKVEYRASSGGTSIQTAEDMNMATTHTVVVTGLSPNTLYAFKALSTSQGLQTAQSDERAVRTQR
jgi:hypothetical protein